MMVDTTSGANHNAGVAMTGNNNNTNAAYNDRNDAANGGFATLNHLPLGALPAPANHLALPGFGGSGPGSASLPGFGGVVRPQQLPGWGVPYVVDGAFFSGRALHCPVKIAFFRCKWPIAINVFWALRKKPHL